MQYNEVMDKQAIIRKILSASQTQGSSNASFSGGAAWLGQPSGIDQQVTAGLEAWLQRGDTEAIIAVIELLQTVSFLTPTEARELLDAVRSA